MFDFLFQNKKGELQSLSDLISVEVKKMKITKMAIEKAIGMIAHAIAKSEFIVQGKNERLRNELYWNLNVRPNPNETATEFWIEVIQRLLKNSECLICIIGKKFYIADSFRVSNSVMLNQTYSNITITANGESLQLNNTYTSDEVIHLKAKNKKIRAYMETVMKMHDDVVSAMEAAVKVSKTPKFILKIAGAMPVIRTIRADGTEQTLTVDEFKKNIKNLLESENIEILQASNGLEISQLKIDTNVTSEDVVKISKEIFEECAFAFDIPKTVFMGEITEKADSTNEFITYAVGWVAEILNDAMNATLVGRESFLKGEYIWIDLSGFKHRDLVESANYLDKLRAIGFSLDEIRQAIGWEPLNTPFSQERVITKNYTNDLGVAKTLNSQLCVK